MRVRTRRRAWVGVAGGLVAAAVALSACNALSPYAAIVNGQRISQQQLNRELKALRGNAAFVTAYDSSAQQQTPARPGILAGNTAGPTYSQSFVAAVLGLDVQAFVIHAEVVRRRIEPTSAAVNDPATVSAASQLFGTDASGKPIFPTFPAWLRNEFDLRQAEEDALGKALGTNAVSDAQIQQFYAQNQADFITTECVAHILVASQAQAAAVLSQLQGGAPFAAVAAATSTDASTATKGGDLGCNPPGQGSNQVDLDQQFQAAATAAPLHQPTGPVQVSGGWDVLEVSSRTVSPLTAALKQQIQQQLQSQAAAPLNQFFTQAATTLKVDVNPIYGHWDTQQLTVVAPTSPDPVKSGVPSANTTPPTTLVPLPSSGATPGGTGTPSAPQPSPTGQ